MRRRYGTQGGGWGVDAGAVVFDARSRHNGRVSVTAHAAAAAPGAQWRVLRFNADTRQSVALCAPQPGGGVAARPEVLGMEYIRVIAAQALGLWRLRAGCADDDDDGNSRADAAPPRVLCVGGGGYSLPLFLARFLPPGAVLDVCEIDEAVADAATHMGVPAAAAALAPRAALRLHTRAAEEFLLPPGRGAVAGAGAGTGAEQAPAVAYPRDELYDIVVLDAFDGDNQMPAALLAPPFLAALAAALHPRRGAVLLNTHGGTLPPLRVDEAAAAALRRLRGLPPDAASRRWRGYDAAAPDGRRVAAAAAALAAALRADARAVRVERQGNIIVSVLPGEAGGDDAAAAWAERLRGAAQEAGAAAGVPFDCGERAVRGMHVAAAAPQ